MAGKRPSRADINRDAIALVAEPVFQRAVRRIVDRFSVTDAEMTTAINAAIATALTDFLVALNSLFQPLSLPLSSAAAAGEGVPSAGEFMFYWEGTAGAVATIFESASWARDFIGDASTAESARVILDISGANTPLNSAGWSGSLSGSGITNVQELADWIDANVVILP
jgi:hypothetical protein